jgi:hypothetical protein
MSSRQAECPLARDFVRSVRSHLQASLPIWHIRRRVKKAWGKSLGKTVGTAIRVRIARIGAR